MCRFVLAVVTLIALAHTATAQYIAAPYGAKGPRTLAIAESDVADPREAQCDNPAMRSDSSVISPMISPFTLGASFSPAPQSLAQSWMGSASAVYGYEHNTFAASFSTFQYQSIYSDQSAALLYSRTFLLSKQGDTVRAASAGARVRYSTMGFGAYYQPLTEVFVDAGATFDIAPGLRAGAAVTNLVALFRNQTASTVGDAISSDVTTGYLGVSWQAIDNVRLDAALEAPAGEASAFHVGIDAEIDPHLFVRVGTETTVGLLTAGLGLRYDNLQLDFALVQHPILGSTVIFGILYAL